MTGAQEWPSWACSWSTAWAQSASAIACWRPATREAEMSVTLRPIVAADKDQILRWRNAPHVAEYMYTNHEISQEEHDRWFARALTRDDAKYWIIEADGAGVGLASIYAIDRVNQRCYWAFYLGDQSAQGRGVGAFVEY